MCQETWEEMKHIHTRNTKVTGQCSYVLRVCVCVYLYMYLIIYFSTYICVTKEKSHEVGRGDTGGVGGREDRVEIVSSYMLHCTNMHNTV